MIKWDYEKLKINVNCCRVPVVVLFWVPSPECTMQTIVFDGIEDDYRNKAVFARVRLDEYEGDLAISQTPSTVITVNGKVATIFQGYVNAEDFRKSLDSYIMEMSNGE